MTNPSHIHLCVYSKGALVAQAFGGLGHENGIDGSSKPHNLSDMHQMRLSLTDDFTPITQGLREDFMQVLPAEVSAHILSFLPFATIGAILPLVSKRWKW